MKMTQSNLSLVTMSLQGCESIAGIPRASLVLTRIEVYQSPLLSSQCKEGLKLVPLSQMSLSGLPP